MVTLDQVQLLETKIAKVIEHVERVTEENTFLKEKLEDYQKRIDELEVLIQRFREEQNRIEEGILASLNRLNQFEAAVTKSLSSHKVPADAPNRDGGGENSNIPADNSPLDAGGEGEEAELNAPAEGESEESDDDIIFVSEGRKDNSITGEEDDEETVSPDKPVDSAELDIF